MKKRKYQKRKKFTKKSLFIFIGFWICAIGAIGTMVLTLLSIKSYQYYMSLKTVYSIETNKNKVLKVKQEFKELASLIGSDILDIDIAYNSVLSYQQLYNQYINILEYGVNANFSYLNYFIDSYLDGNKYDKLTLSLINDYPYLKSYTYSWFILLNNVEKDKPTNSMFALGLSLSVIFFSIDLLFIIYLVVNKKKNVLISSDIDTDTDSYVNNDLDSINISNQPNKKTKKKTTRKYIKRKTSISKKTISTDTTDKELETSRNQIEDTINKSDTSKSKTTKKKSSSTSKQTKKVTSKKINSSKSKSTRNKTSKKTTKVSKQTSTNRTVKTNGT